MSHHVGVSVVGCELVPMGYFRVKAEQERVVEHGPVPWSLVRATQFHELAAATLAAGGRWHVLPVPRARLQTVACADVARAVTGAHAVQLPVPLPGKLGRALRGGALTARHPDVRGGITFAAWLAGQDDRAAVSPGRASRP